MRLLTLCFTKSFTKSFKQTEASACRKCAYELIKIPVTGIRPVTVCEIVAAVYLLELLHPTKLQVDHVLYKTLVFRVF